MLALVSGITAINAWLVTGWLEPIVRGERLDFVLAVGPAWQLLVWWAGFAAVIAALRYFFQRRALDCPLEPLLLLLWPPVALLLLATPAVSRISPWLYVFVDLRWWWFGAVLLVECAAIDAANGHRWSARIRNGLMHVGPREGRRVWFELALIGMLGCVSLLASPVNRFKSSLIGDEPKYVRFLENWYRGQGFDISTFPDLNQLPPNQPPRIGADLVRAVSATRQIARDLMIDVPYWLGLSSVRTPGHASSGGGWFVGAKHGGVYQVHTPGVSLLLLPGYVIDRYFLNSTSEVHPQFPTNLYATNLSLLGLYLLWAVALFRLLGVSSNNQALAWLLTVMAMLSLPASAFSYQYYPEAAAGFFLTVLIGYAMRESLTSTGAAFAFGLVAGYLPWLHMRFGPAAIIVGAAVWWHPRRSHRVPVAFVAGLLIPMSALALYTYYLSGSPLPWSLYSVIPDSPGFSVTRVIYDLPKFWLDRQRGLLAHAPVYVFAAAGLVEGWRRQPRLATLVIGVAGSVAVLSAAHEWGGGDSTPLRLVTAVTPLLMIFVASAVSRAPRSRWMMGGFVALAILSVDNALVYHQHLVKTSQYMLLSDASSSGWKSSLLLPMLSPGQPVATVLVAAWVGITLVAFAWPLLSREPNRTRRASWSRVAAVLAVAVALAGSATSAIGEPGFDLHYLRDETRVRNELLNASLRGEIDSALLAMPSSVRRINIAAMYPNPPNAIVTIRPSELQVRAGEPLAFRVDAYEPQRDLAWGTLRVDFGDGTMPAKLPIVGRAPVPPHVYRDPGDFRITMDVTGPGNLHVVRSEMVHVSDR